MTVRAQLIAAALSISAGLAPAGEQPANRWVRMATADIACRWQVPLVYSPEVGRFMIQGGGARYDLGGQPYQDLAYDEREGRWENWYPKGASFGPQFGACSPPAFRSYLDTSFADQKGNARVNPGVVRHLYGAYAHVPDLGKFFFFAAMHHESSRVPEGKTFSYSPTERAWREIKTEASPVAGRGGKLLWSAMCYHPDRRRIVLFGGGNVRSDRGDPGTWTFDPEKGLWAELKLDQQPSPRANSAMVYDPSAKRIVLFGGDGLDQLLADTWTFDGEKWEELRPALSPSPRAGHAMLWLPKAKKVMLLGGYAYASTGYPLQRAPLDAWMFDSGAGRWDLLMRGETPSPSQERSPLPYRTSIRAAVNGDDLVTMVCELRDSPCQTWQCRVDASRTDGAGTAELAVKPGTVVRRTGPYDAKWYVDGLPQPDPTKVAAEYQALPVNRWVHLDPPRVAAPECVGWGSAVYLPKPDLIVRFSGGHSYYCGTAPFVYDPKIGRWSIPFAPEMPIDWCHDEVGISGAWSFKGNPWMPGHTWKATGGDGDGARLVYPDAHFTWFFDPAKGRWERSVQEHPRLDVRSTTLCATPQGTVAWSRDHSRPASGAMALWLIDSRTGAWAKLPLKGDLPRETIDRNGLAYDSKRDRVLIFAPEEKDHDGDVVSYDMKTGEAKWLNPVGRQMIKASDGPTRFRETIFIPEQDLAMVGGRIKGPEGKYVWLFYDCAGNRWRCADLPGDDPLAGGSESRWKPGGQPGASSVSIGMMYDSCRKLIWVAGGMNDLFVLKFDPRTAGLIEFK